MADQQDFKRALVFALESYPERVVALPVDQVLLDSARQSAKRPAYLKVAVPDEMVKAMRGSADRRSEVVLLVTVPREVVERSESPIILPNEV